MNSKILISQLPKIFVLETNLKNITEVRRILPSQENNVFLQIKKRKFFFRQIEKETKTLSQNGSLGCDCIMLDLILCFSCLIKKTTFFSQIC